MDNLSTTCNSQEEPVFNVELFERARREIKKIESKPRLVGISVNKRDYEKLMRISVERKVPDGYPSCEIGCFSGVRIVMRKYQRGIRSFYNTESFRKFLVFCT